jgi:hypothetical protein
MADLGLRLPMMETEYETNPNISPGDPGTTVVVPDYIPAAKGMDLYTPLALYDDEGVLQTDLVTITFDMNKVLVANRVSPFR